MSKQKNKGKKPENNDIENEVKNAGNIAEADAAEETEEVSAEAVEEKFEESSEEPVEEKSDVEETAADEETAEESDGKENAADTVRIAGADEETKKANEEFRKLSFGEKCKRDPLIPISLLLVFVAIVVGAAYFILPNVICPSMGMTLEEFRTRFDAADISKALMNNGLDIGFIGIDYVDPDTNPSILGDNAIVSANRSFADFFEGESRSYLVNSGIDGATRKTDNELAYVRIYIEYAEDVNPVWMYFSNILLTLYPDLTMNDAMDIALKLMGEYNGSDVRFDSRGDYAFRMVPVTKNEVNYIAFDVVPKALLSSSQIRYNLDTEEKFAVASSAAVSETVQESVQESGQESAAST